MISIFETISPLYVRRMQYCMCPECGDLIEFEENASPARCWGCNENILDISLLVASPAARLMYHLGMDEMLKVDLSAYGWA